MAKIIKFFQTIRNNWKKSVVGTAALSYGISYSKDTYNKNQLMREYCHNAVKYGDIPLPTNVKPRHVTVILNPAAKNGKAKTLFQKYCEPLLHLAGIAVTVIQTKSDKAARKIIMNLDTPTDAIIVAGGDGTLSDVLTGLVRKYNSNLNSVKQCPIGIIPLGATNTVGKSLYQKYDNLHDVRTLIEATMAIIYEKSKLKDIIEIMPLEGETEEQVQPTYAMGAVQWGAWRDAHALVNKYWYWGSLRKYVAYIFNGYKQKLNWNCNAILKYTDPCSGCSHCYQRHYSQIDSSNINKRWWHAFIPRTKTVMSDNSVDYSQIINENCGVYHEMPIATTELHIETSNVNRTNDTASKPSLKVEIGPKNVGYSTFVSEGWKQEKDGKLLIDTELDAKDIELIPEKVDQERSFYIDNEDYELRPVRIKLLPQAVKIFCPESGS